MNYIQSFLNYKSNRRAVRKNTYISYASDLKRTFEYFKNNKGYDTQEDFLNKVNGLDIDEYIDWMQFNEDNQLSISTVNRTISVLRQFNQYLLDRGQTDNNFMKGQKKLVYNDEENRQKSPRVKDYISKEDFNKIINATSQGGYKGMKYKWLNIPRNKFILTFMASTGTRIDEVLNIRLDRIIYKHGIPWVIYEKKDTKRKIKKCIPICGKCLDFYNEYMEQRKKIKDIVDGGYIILSHSGKKINDGDTNDFLDKVCKSCNINKHITNHSFRHLFSAVGNTIGLNPVLINVIGGWSNNSIMQWKYAENNIINDDESKLKAVEDIQNFLFE